MISMGSIWDRTLEVVRGRTGILVGIAALLIALPAALSGGFIQYVTAYAPQLVAVVGLASIIVGVLQIWGGLALVAVASDPAVDQGTGIARGGARLPLTIGLYILLGIAAVILFVPLFAVVGVSVLRAFPGGHYDADLLPGTMTAGIVGFGILYLLAALVVVLWISARLSVLLPVVVNERRGIGSIARSWQLTRGLTWKIIGVFLLYGVVSLVLLGAVQVIVALPLRLAFGADGVVTVAMIAAVVQAIVSAGLTILSSVFLAQLYNAITGREAATTFE